MGRRVAFITGISGQDGSYLCEHLLSHGYEVHGLVRPGEVAAGNFQSYEADLSDPDAIRAAIAMVMPTECYHLGAQTFVYGEELPTVRVNVNGTLHVLEALRHIVPRCRLFFAGSAEMFGQPEACPQDEATVMRPRSVYGASKVAAYQLVRVYREQHGLFSCCGILYNHESPRRGTQFVTRKITRAAARIKHGKDHEVYLGNLDAIRDWGHARDYVRAMRLMLQQEQPDDYVVATGQGRTVRDFVEAAFKVAGLDWRNYVHIAQELYRPAEKVPLIGLASKAEKQLGWRPTISFDELVREMVEWDLAAEAR